MDLQHGDGLVFTPSQVAVLRWIPVFPGLLSAIGSFLIAQRVVRSKKLRGTTYERLMLGLSSVDILNSIRLMVVPARYFPFTDPSPACTASGFLITLGFAGPMYNAVLSMYYLLVVVYDFTAHRIEQSYELWFHIIPIAYGVSAAFLGLAMGVYNPERDSVTCWVAEWPHRCVGDECERGPLSAVFATAVVYVPLLGVLILLIATNTAIFVKVRSVFRKTSEYSMSSRNLSGRQSFSSKISEPPKGVVKDGAAQDPPSRLERGSSSFRFSSSTSSPTDCKIRQVGVQSILYVVAYLFCYIWSLIAGIATLLAPDRVERGDFFSLTVVEMTLFPAQGLFNAFVYARPVYERARRQDPDLSRWQCFRKALLDPME